MADVLKDVTENTAIKATLANDTVVKAVTSTEGMFVAYFSLVVMAIMPILIGSFRSIPKLNEKGVKKNLEVMTSRDAALFPLIASASLFTLYMVFKVFSKEHINLLLSTYFLILGVAALTDLFRPFVTKIFPSRIPIANYSIKLRQETGKVVDEVEYTFSTCGIVTFVICSCFGVWYMYQKHWIANNLFGIAFSIYGVELLQLNNIVTGCILLGGLFFYDVFWVFGTDVMVTVAKSFEAPIKLVFPQDIFINGLSASNFAMLGLGDIVIPGIFIALLLRFDKSLKRNQKTYFYGTLLAYLVGLLTTIGIMHIFKHAQPALLYLVPACVSTPLVIALVKGDIQALFKYDESENIKPEKTIEQAVKKSEESIEQPQSQSQTQQSEGEKKEN